MLRSNRVYLKQSEKGLSLVSFLQNRWILPWQRQLFCCNGLSWAVCLSIIKVNFKDALYLHATGMSWGRQYCD